MTPASRDEHCPSRGAGLRHTMEGGRCVHCGVAVTAAPQGDFSAAQPSPDDRPHVAICRVCRCPAAACYRIGYGPTLEWMCLRHILEIARGGRDAGSG